MLPSSLCLPTLGRQLASSHCLAPPPSLFLVYKFGGSSVGTAERLKQVVATVAGLSARLHAEAKPGPYRKTLLVVVSAMGNTTDHLLDAADYAASGDMAAAESCIDRVAELAISQAMAVCASGHNPPSLIANVRLFLSPLRDILKGMSLLREVTPLSLDFALSFGERLSAFLMSQILRTKGIAATFVDARSWVETDAHFGNAKVKWNETCENVRALWGQWASTATHCRVAVHTGFIGQTTDGRTTTLGRNGSDYTATLLGSALRANRVVINTDVDGVMTADPRIVKEAVPVANLSYREALGLADYGTGMFHPRTFLPLMETGVPMYLQNSLATGREGCGTCIDRDGSGRTQTREYSKENSGGENIDEEQMMKDATPPLPHDSPRPRPTCVTSLENLVMLEIVSRRKCGTSREDGAEADDNFLLGATISTALAGAKVNILMESQAAHGQSAIVVVTVDDQTRAKLAIERALARQIENRDVDDVQVTEPVTMISVVQANIRKATNVAARFTGTLGALGISILAVAEGSHSFTCTINGASTKRAVRAVHAAFNLSNAQCSVVVLAAPNGLHGSATTSAALVKVVEQQSPMLEREHSLCVRIVGVLQESGGEIQCDGKLWEYGKEDGSLEACIDSALEYLKTQPSPIFVDCSLRPRKGLYKRCLGLGINVVLSSAASVCGLSELIGPNEKYLTSSQCGAYLLYDSTVGGSLPILPSIRSLLRTGDRVISIECALSGSMNYITCEISRGVSPVEAIKAAIDAKFMEEDPRVDLSGLDFARKLVVIARQLGVPLTVEGIQRQPLIPESIVGAPNEELEMTTATASELYTKLANFDWGSVSKDKGSHLRFSGGIKFDATSGPKAYIRPQVVSRDSQLFHVRGKEIFISFQTERHRTFPLTFFGSGQGGKEGACGVLGDIIRVAQRLRGWGVD
eukprot:g8577.t1